MPKRQMSEKTDRVVAALSNLGFPLMVLGLPLIVWSLAPVESLRRAHARRAFAYQLTCFVVFVGLFIPVVFDGPAAPMLVWIAAWFLVQLLQVVRALRGEPPYPLPPFQVLKR